MAIELAHMFAAAPVYTTFYERARFGERLDPARVRSWPLAGVPTRPWFRPLLPAYIGHFSRLRIPAARLLITTSSTFARGASATSGAKHVAYIHSPMRFAWDVDGYLAGSTFPLAARLGLRLTAPALRRWDRWAGSRPDVLVANSDYVRRRIRKVWRRNSTVIHPPVDVARRSLSADTDDYYLVSTRLIAHKRVELAILACEQLGRRLVIVGDGPERRALERRAGPRTTFLGHMSTGRLEHFQNRCRAVLVPGVEDFGMAAVEAMAAGRPVVAYAAGGALETVVDGTSGVFFHEPSWASLADAIGRIESLRLDPGQVRQHAMQFDASVFRRRWRHLLESLSMEDLLPEES